jgi:hypothetical protein
VRFDDGTFGVIDFKTSSAEKSSSLYGRQLHAYAAGIESPSSESELIQGVVSDLGLIVYEPSAFSTLSPSGAAMTGDLTYVNIPRNDSEFEAFLGQVVDVLGQPEAPPPPKPTKRSWSGSVSSCPYCQFLHDASTKDLINI